MAKGDGAKTKISKSAKHSDKAMIYGHKREDILKANDLIGSKLREYYDEVARQPVPDRFAALLDQLEGKSAAKKPS